MGNDLISIPEYFAKYVNPSIDLTQTSKICCPFHQEDTPSFSYSAEKGVWRCFGACKDGGDVIALHRRNYGLKTREEAENSLYKLLGITRIADRQKVRTGTVDEYVKNYKEAYGKAVLVATTPEAWIELDYIMSQHPVDVNKLRTFYECHRKVEHS